MLLFFGFFFLPLLPAFYCTLKVMLHGTIRNDDFKRNTSL